MPGARDAGFEALRRALGSAYDVAGAAYLPARVADCKWILAHIDEIEAKIERPGLIDVERTAMAGHSAGAMTTQALAGIRFFATGGIGGVHRDWQRQPDVSTDLFALSRSPLAVVSAGFKSVLDVAATCELLESLDTGGPIDAENAATNSAWRFFDRVWARRRS